MVNLPSPYNKDEIERYTDRLLDLVETPLVCQITGGIHVNDALIYGAWERLPSKWAEWWATLPDQRIAQRDLIDSIDEELEVDSSKGADDCGSAAPGVEVRPASLTQWLAELRSLSLPRTQRTNSRTNLPEVLTERMKSKKIEEVSVAAAYIHDICQNHNITRVIDMGSGQGYLSLSLAHLFPDLRILAIDGSERQIAASKTCASSLGLGEDRVTHLVRYIDGTAPLVAEMADWSQDEPCMLVGLHACGNLSEHMLRYFNTVPFITCLGAVGCCYNHIVPRSPEAPDGFPISAKLRARGTKLSATALMTGCQAPNNWPRSSGASEARVTGGEESMYSKRRFYRALLEKVFHDKGITVPTTAEGQRPIWGIRKGDMSSFTTFARRATHCLGLDGQQQIADSELEVYEVRHKADEAKIAILWTLSILCCKVVESVIAMDRYWYLVENGAKDVDVLPIFDYRISPRNLMIVATKEAE